MAAGGHRKSIAFFITLGACIVALAMLVELAKLGAKRFAIRVRRHLQLGPGGVTAALVRDDIGFRLRWFETCCQDVPARSSMS